MGAKLNFLWGGDQCGPTVEGARFGRIDVWHLMGDSGGLGATCGVLELEWAVGCPSYLLLQRPWRKLRREHLEYIKCEACQLRSSFRSQCLQYTWRCFVFFFSNTEIKGVFLRLLYYSVRTSRTKVFFGNYLSLVQWYKIWRPVDARLGAGIVIVGW